MLKEEWDRSWSRLLPLASSFSVLSNNEIMPRASLMGIDMPSNNFESIDMLQELEKAKVFCLKTMIIFLLSLLLFIMIMVEKLL
jgi:hypothetical protein